MRAVSGLWRWRSNPLRRATDLAEAWVTLVAVVLLAVASPLVGFAVGTSTHQALQRTVREQRHARHLVVATVVRRLGGGPVDTDSDTITARDSRSRVLAAWTAPDGSHHRGAAHVGLRSPRHGDRFALWTDPHGRITNRPLDAPTATTHAVLAGLGAALLAAGVVESARRLVVWHMVRHRYTLWERAWDRAGPDWGKAGTGS
ncbi:hypothetical protein KUM39_00740 [Streptomyces sp. J2-1]|uniref:Rv1733c family protein n=1 Tax=Streptomyces corallincola TaxID=2851888 RepID=UPI001C38EF06|nr:hypothetical protein [Streptomyces corallincola]MBV2352896.1 hypothetical protein [Streptomyces corallincola]